jgi:hypothetical protein
MSFAMSLLVLKALAASVAFFIPLDSLWAAAGLGGSATLAIRRDQPSGQHEIYRPKGARAYV